MESDEEFRKRAAAWRSEHQRKGTMFPRIWMFMTGRQRLHMLNEQVKQEENKKILGQAHPERTWRQWLTFQKPPDIIEGIASHRECEADAEYAVPITFFGKAKKYIRDFWNQCC